MNEIGGRRFPFEMHGQFDDLMKRLEVYKSNMIPPTTFIINKQEKIVSTRRGMANYHYGSIQNVFKSLIEELEFLSKPIRQAVDEGAVLLQCLRGELPKEMVTALNSLMRLF